MHTHVHTKNLVKESKCLAFHRYNVTLRLEGQTEKRQSEEKEEREENERRKGGSRR